MNKKGPILLANFSAAWGGGELWFLSVGRALRAKGLDVHWWVKEGSVLEKKLAKLELPHFTTSGRASDMFSPSKVNNSIKAIKRIQPDLMLLNASHELKFGGLMGKLAGVPNIIFRRGVSYPLSENAFNRWYIRNVTTGFLANSNSTFQAFAHAFPNILNNVHTTIYNGIELKPYGAVSSNPQDGLIIMSARLSPEKGIDRALLVMQKVKQLYPQAHLRILGDGPQRAALEQQAKALGLEQHVTFAGFVDNVINELSKANLFLFTPTRGEGTSFALLEAMACGLPCVAFESPSLDEVILHEQTGFLFPAEHMKEMAHSIHSLLTQADMRKTMGEASRTRAFSHFSLERLTDQFLTFYHSI
ncbi:MAG: glycosyltransferase family 4 protein [Bacteroidia bacterium]